MNLVEKYCLNLSYLFKSVCIYEFDNKFMAYNKHFLMHCAVIEAFNTMLYGLSSDWFPWVCCTYNTLFSRHLIRILTNLMFRKFMCTAQQT